MTIFGRGGPIREKVNGLIREDFNGEETDLRKNIISAIIHLRRNKDVENQKEIFFDYYYNNTDQLIKELNSRWLISVVDTVADYGTDLEKANACLVSLFFNTLKFVESYLYTVKDSERCNKKTRGLPLWDGIMMFNLDGGDAARNLYKRIRISLQHTKELDVIFTELLNRARNNSSYLKSLKI